MGSRESKLSTKDSCSLFTKKELDKLHGIFALILKDAKDTDRCSLSSLSAYLKQYYIDNKLIKHLHGTLCSLSEKDGAIVEEFNIYGLCRYLAMLFKGTAAEQALSISVLISKQNFMTKEQILQFLESISSTYFTLIKSHSNSQHWTSPGIEDISELCNFMFKNVKTPKKDELNVNNSGGESKYEETDVEKWIYMTPLLLHIIHLVFQTCFNFYSVDDSSQRFTEPVLPQTVMYAPKTSLLNQSYVTLLNSQLPVDCQKAWRLLFSSREHGDSFTQLVTRIEHQGPVLVVVEDSNGYIFGAYCSVDLSEQSDFFGSHSSFLFKLKPEICVYNSSGHNDHYVYLNHSAKTLPNGLGFGGHLGYCGLWIDGSFTNGHSKGGPLCSTFDSPTLSHMADFIINNIEVWGVLQKQQTDDNEERSILDVDPGAKAILELIGRGTCSDGLRDNDETAGIPGEHSLHPL